MTADVSASGTAAPGVTSSASTVFPELDSGVDGGEDASVESDAGTPRDADVDMDSTLPTATTAPGMTSAPTATASQIPSSVPSASQSAQPPASASASVSVTATASATVAPTAMPSSDPDSGLLTCAQGSQFEDSCYVVTTTDKTRDAAEQECVTLGFHLAEIFSVEENTFVHNLAPTTELWLGANRNGTNWQWEFTAQIFFNGLTGTGTVPSGAYATWAVGQPTGAVDELCVRMLADATWGDQGCTVLERAVCKGPAL